MTWARPEFDRKQLLLFSRTLEDEIPEGHAVRLIDQILERVDWRPWESNYHQVLGQPAIHPRILASILLYGLMCRIRASRQLEDALQFRMDFRWLAHGMSIDHTTLSEFRRKHPEALRDLFVQVVMIGRELGLVKLQRLAFDGTRVRANNRKSGTRTSAQLWKLKQQLEEEFDRLNQKADAQDSEDDEDFGGGTNPSTAAASAEKQQQERDLIQAMHRVEAALAELEKINSSSESPPGRLPITDPESRFTKNKGGGFAPNYTPTATVDTDSGLIIDQTVIPQSNESGELEATLRQVQTDHQLTDPVPEVLADGLMATTENLVTCEEQRVVLYSPVPGAHVEDNPAVRVNLRDPVPADQIDALPMRTVNTNGQRRQRFDKQAFVYDAAANVYVCPAGQELAYSSTYTTKERGRQLTRRRYRSQKSTCMKCPLAVKCLSGRANFRQIDRGEHEEVVARHNARMKSSAAQEIYATRWHVGERPFAVIKEVFGLRQFLTRGLQRVRTEWAWATIAFNLRLLATRLPPGVPP